MTFKKWRPFWSYDIDRTEKYLSDMAQKGYQLYGINRITRMFSFQKVDGEEVNYHISYDKYQQEIPRTLSDSGWGHCLSEGNWAVLANRKHSISLFPARDELVKRNRSHALMWKIISGYYGFQLILPVFLLVIVLGGGGSAEFESSPYWWITILYFLQVIGVLILTLTMTRKLKAFERIYYDMEVDVETSVGKTFAKWKPHWMMRPAVTEKWLEEMAMSGNYLVKVQATRFVFEKRQPKQVAYALDFQWKASPVYAEIHKSSGWKFIHKTAQSFLKTAIWAKEYQTGEEKPQLTYDAKERKAQKQKVVVAHGGTMIFMLLLIGFILRGLINSSMYIDWSLYHSFLVFALIVTIVIDFYLLIRIIFDAIKTNI